VRYELLVLGGGAQALLAAARAARGGARVALATEAPAVGGELLTASFLSPFRFDVGGGLVRGLDDELERFGLAFVRVTRPFPAALVRGGAGLLAHALADEIVAHGGLVLEGVAADQPALESDQTLDARAPERERVGRVFLGVVGEAGLPELGVVEAADGYAVVHTDADRPGGRLVSVTWTGEGPQDAANVAERLGVERAPVAFSLVWQPEDVAARRF
jgi:phytoene dehydrogenase-like protein